MLWGIKLNSAMPKCAGSVQLWRWSCSAVAYFAGTESFFTVNKSSHPISGGETTHPAQGPLTGCYLTWKDLLQLWLCLNTEGWKDSCPLHQGTVKENTDNRLFWFASEWQSRTDISPKQSRHPEGTSKLVVAGFQLTWSDVALTSGLVAPWSAPAILATAHLPLFCCSLLLCCSVLFCCSVLLCCSVLFCCSVLQSSVPPPPQHPPGDSVSWIPVGALIFIPCHV